MKIFVKKFNIMRYIAVFLATIVFCFSLAAVKVEAALDSGNIDGLKWSVTGGTLEITGKGEMPDFTERNMAPWSKYNKQINRIIIDDRITRIGNLAFYDFSSILTVELSKNVKSIGDMAFAGCSSLKSIIISGVEKIGEYAFSRCFKLYSVVLPETLNELGGYAFYRCESLVSVIVPASVKTMGGSVFAYCSSLLTAVIKAPIVKLPEWTFYGCTSLIDVTIPKETVSVGDRAFEDCDVLVNIFHSGTNQETESFIEDIKKSDPNFETVIIKPTPENSTPTTSVKYETQGDVGYKTETEIIVGQDTSIEINTTTTHEVKGEYEYGTEIEDAKIEISASLKGENGWDNLISEIEKQVLEQGALEIQIGNNAKVPIIVDVALVNDSYIYGKDLEDLAGKYIILKVTTPNGSRWSIDCSMLKRYKFKKKYNLDYEISLYQNVSKGHQKTLGVVTCYWLSFADKIDFPATVEPYIDHTASRLTATLYEKAGINKLNLIQSVMIDSNGVAYYKMGNINKGQRYIVALNVAGIAPEDVILPENSDDWLENYIPITEQYKITDVRGFLGLTMKEFTNILIFGGLGLVFVVFVVILAINFTAKKKALEQISKKN